MAYCPKCRGEHVKGHRATGEVVWNPSTGRYERSTGRYVTVGGSHTRSRVVPRAHLTVDQRRRLGICVDQSCQRQAVGRGDYCAEHGG
jgi:hypothetical protein